jgi:tRNA threonylcarbamoyladenosine biosynthesis protein TsaB
MKLAAIDTSTRWCSGALLEMDDDGAVRVLAEAGVHAHDSHTARLLPLLDGLLRDAGWERGAIDLWVATRGPGSFTGLRIGLGTVRGLAAASGRPCVGVGTLPALAHAAGPCEAPRIPVLDAGRGELYAARFDAASCPPEERDAPWVGPPETFAGAFPGPGVVFGPGRFRLATADLPEGTRVASCPRAVAAAAGELAAARVAAGGPGPESLAPIYVRPPDAVLSPRNR